MKSKILCLFVMATFVLIFVATIPSFAGDKYRQGDYWTATGKSGTFVQGVSRKQGETTKSLFWTDQSGGTGNHSVQRKLNKESGNVTFSGSTELPNGFGVSSNRTVTKAPEGGLSVQGTYTTAAGKSLTVNKTIQKLDNGFATTGTYATGGGKSGTFLNAVGVVDGKLVKTQALTTSSGKNLQHVAQTGVQNGTLTRTDVVAGPKGNMGTLTTTATAKMTDQGLSINGSYNTGSGGSGTFQSSRNIDENGNLVTNQSITNTQGKSITRDALTTIKQGKFSQDVSMTGPKGDKTDYSRGINVNQKNFTH
jgi:hypothetical protein